MSRVKRSNPARRRHKKILAQTKGYRHGRKNVYRQAKQAAIRAGQQSYRDRRTRKRTFRRHWIVQINAACRQNGITYRVFIAGLKKSGIDLDRKVLSELAVKNPREFERLVEKINK